MKNTGVLQEDGCVLWDGTHAESNFVVGSQKFLLHKDTKVGDVVKMEKVERDKRKNTLHRYNVSTLNKKEMDARDKALEAFVKDEAESEEELVAEVEG